MQNVNYNSCFTCLHKKRWLPRLRSVDTGRSDLRMVEMLVESTTTHDGYPCYCCPQLLERQAIVDGAIEGSYWVMFMTCWFLVARSIERKMVMLSFQPQKRRRKVHELSQFFLPMVFVKVEMTTSEEMHDY